MAAIFPQSSLRVFIVLLTYIHVSHARLSPIGFAVVNSNNPLNYELAVSQGHDNGFLTLTHLETPSAFVPDHDKGVIRFNVVNKAARSTSEPTFLPTSSDDFVVLIAVYDEKTGKLSLYNSEIPSSMTLIDYFNPSNSQLPVIGRLYAFEGHAHTFDSSPLVEVSASLTERVKFITETPPNDIISINADFHTFHVAVISGQPTLKGMKHEWLQLPIGIKCSSGVSCELGSQCDTSIPSGCSECPNADIYTSTLQSSTCINGVRQIRESKHELGTCDISQEIVSVPCICGDGVIDLDLGEHCDNGMDFGPTSSCRSDCKLSCQPTYRYNNQILAWTDSFTGHYSRAVCPTSSPKFKYFVQTQNEIIDQDDTDNLPSAIGYCCGPLGTNPPEVEQICREQGQRFFVLIEDCFSLDDVLDQLNEKEQATLSELISLNNRTAKVLQTGDADADIIDKSVEVLNKTAQLTRNLNETRVPSQELAELLAASAEIVDGILKSESVELLKSLLRPQVPNVVEDLCLGIGILLRTTTDGVDEVDTQFDEVFIRVSRIRSGSNYEFRTLSRSYDAIRRSTSSDGDGTQVTLDSSDLEGVVGSISLVEYGSDTLIKTSNSTENDDDEDDEEKQVVTPVLSLSINPDEPSESSQFELDDGTLRDGYQLNTPVVISFPRPEYSSSFALRKAAESGDIQALKTACELEVEPDYLDNRPFTCAFYDEIDEEWKSDGCESEQMKDGSYVCKCSHLTNFAVILTDGDVDHQVFSILTQVGLGISCVLFGIILITYYFIDYESRSTDTLTVHLIIALFMFDVLFLATIKHARVTVKGSNDAGIVTGCHMSSFFTYFFLMAVFGWSAVQAIELYFKFVTRTPRTIMNHSLYVRYLVLGWGVPLLLSLFLFVDIEHMITMRNNAAAYCWIDGKSSLIAILIVPMCITLLFNIVQFTRSMITLKQAYDKSDHMKIMELFRVAVIFFALLSLTWLFGLLLLIDDSEALQALFIIGSVLQAISLFYFKFIRHPLVRRKIGLKPLSSTPSRGKSKVTTSSKPYHQPRPNQTATTKITSGSGQNDGDDEPTPRNGSTSPQQYRHDGGDDGSRRSSRTMFQRHATVVPDNASSSSNDDDDYDEVSPNIGWAAQYKPSVSPRHTTTQVMVSDHDNDDVKYPQRQSFSHIPDDEDEANGYIDVDARSRPPSYFAFKDDVDHI